MRRFLPMAEKPSGMEGSRIAVIGTGRMGGAMVRNLVKHGNRLTIYDIRLEATVPLEGPRCRIASSPGAAARDADFILTSLTGPEAVEQALCGPDGVLGAVRSGAVVIETSTIAPAESQALAVRFADKGAAYLDAPLSGGVAGAKAGTLTVMVGGDEDAYRKARPLLDQIGADIHHMGPSGSGNAIKLVIQLVVMSYFAAFQEAVALGERLGIPLEPMLAVLKTSSAGAPSMVARIDRMLAGDPAPGFEIGSAAKDLGLVADAAATLGFDAAIAGAAGDLYRRAIAAGLADDDLSVIHRILK